MVTTVKPATGLSRRSLNLGDTVAVVGAPAWCRRYLVGRVGRVARVLPLTDGEVWVHFEPPVEPWCSRMDPVEEFPFAEDELALL